MLRSPDVQHEPFHTHAPFTPRRRRRGAQAQNQFKLMHQLQPGQRLEMVDRRCTQLIRVAHVVSRGPLGFVTVAYDGWSEKYNNNVETHSLDLLPAGYCQTTGYPLQPPPSRKY